MVSLKKRRRRGGIPTTKHRRHCGRWWQWMLNHVEKQRRIAQRSAMYETVDELIDVQVRKRRKCAQD